MYLMNLWYSNYSLHFHIFQLSFIVAEQAINFVNHNPDYFSNTEYALTLDVRNLTCSQDVVLNDYFDLLTASKNRKIIGVIGK